MILQENEICPYSNNCPYNVNNTCKGAVTRNNEFSCYYVNDDGSFKKDGVIRNENDVTGKMKVLMENGI